MQITTLVNTVTDDDFMSYTATSLVTVMKINTIFHAVSITVGTGPFIIGVRLINC